MSAVPVLTPPPSRPQQRRRHRVTTRPIPSVRARVHSERRSRVRSTVVAQTATFAVIVCMTFIASSLFGHVMVEKSRREGLRAAERARDARKSESILRQELEGITGLDTVDGWALAHGFVAPGGTHASIAH
jgi:hypothetical protein